MRAISTLRRFFPILNFYAGRGRTLPEAIAEIAPIDTLSHVISVIPDRRLLLQVIAREMKEPEEKILLRISKFMNLPCLLNLQPFNPVILPPNITLATCRSLGAVPVIIGPAIAGIACIDPAAVSSWTSSYPRLQIYLSTWSRICDCINRSERALVEQSIENGIQLDRADQQQQLIEALRLILEEAGRHGQAGAKIQLQGGKATFYFSCTDGRRAAGQIDPALYPSLVELRHNGNIDSTIQIRSGPEDGVLQIAYDDSRSASVDSLPAVTSTGRAGNNGTHPSDRLTIPNGSQNGCPSPAPAGKPPRILVVDDNSAFLTVIERFLTLQGVETTRCDDAEEALRKMMEGILVPDVVLCDLHMPGLSGYDFLSRIRAAEKLTEIPIVILSSDDDLESQLKSLALGADVYLAKSEDPRLLLAHMESLLRRSQSKRFRKSG